MEYEIVPKSKLSLGLDELWQYRELFYFFTWRDIKVKYKQTVLGFAWAVLQPFIMMILFSLFFGDKLYDNQQKTPYAVFVYSGLLLWNVFSTGITSAGNSMVSNANIIKKIYFPRLIIPISSVLVSLFDFFMAFLIFIGILIFYSVEINIYKFLLFLPVSVILTCMATFGLGTLLAALNIKYRDFRYIIPFMVQVLLFLTPVIYPVSAVSNQWLKVVLVFNPMYAPVTLFRIAFMDDPINLNYIIASLFSAFFILFLGLFYFRKTENYFADLA